MQAEKQMPSLEIKSEFKAKKSTFNNLVLKMIFFKSWVAWIILFTCIALTLLLSIYTRKNIEESSKQEFASICNEIEVKLDTRLHAHAQLLRSGAAFFEATDSVSRMEWKAFNDAAKINTNLPGIQGLGYSIIISKDQLQRHIEGIRNEGFPDYTVKPAGQRDIYTSIIYLEPFTGRNLRAFGYDMFSEPVRRKAMEQSRDENVAMISGKVSLVQETNQDVQPGTLMYVPVYKIGKPINTIALRRAAIKGWVYSPYRMKDLMEGILGRWDLKQLKRIQLRVYDDSVSVKSLLYDSQLSDSLKDKGFISQTVVKPVTFNGKQWVLSFTQYNQSFWMQDKTVIVFAAGILVSILLFLLFNSLINTRRRAELLAQNLTEDLKESAERFENLFEKHISVMLLIEPESGAIINANEAAIEFYGYAKSELCSKNINDFNILGSEETLKIQWKILSGELKQMQLSHRLKDGTIHKLEVHGTPVHYYRQWLIFAIIHDITERLQTQEKIKESEERFRTMANSTPALIWMSGTDTLCNYFNQTWLDFTARTLEQEMGNGWATGIHPDDLQTCLDIYLNSFNARQSFSMEYRLHHADGTYHWLLDNGMPRFTADGNFVGYIGSCIDITLSKQASITINETLDRLQKIASRVPGVVYQFKLRPDGTSCFPYASDALNEIYRVTPDEVKENASKVFANLHPDDLAGVAESIQLSAKNLTTWKSEYRVKFNDGTVRWVQGNAIPEKEEDGAILWHGFIADITGRKKTEDILKQSEQRYKDLFNLMESLFDHIPGLVFQKDKNNNFIKVNKYVAGAHGKQRYEMEGKNLAELYSKEAAEKYYQDDLKVINSGIANLNIEESWQTEDGVKWLNTSKIPFKDENGIVTGVLGMSMDITERKKIEEVLKNYAEDLKKSNAELENFAFIASHDLQEPLRMVSSFLTLLDKKYNSQLDEAGKQYITFATDGAARMKTLIFDLLQYSRVGTNKEEFTSVDLNEMMTYITRILKETIETNHAIITINPMPVITANKTLINELFVNLFTNALKYRGEKNPVIEVGYTEGPKEYTFFVKDNGIGINEAYYEKIFVIFQRLHGKGEYSGTGIGLALCKKIVDTHKGKIWVESEVGKGSTFYFSIPKN
jgi:PAS domain S-box-containing protein